MARRTGIILLITAAAIVVAIASLIIIYNGGVWMKDTYYLENVKYDSDVLKVREKIRIKEGDVILQKDTGLKLLPSGMDWVKPVEKKKLTNKPHEYPERLLRVKELNEDGAVIAILNQEEYYEDDMLVTKEYEKISNVLYGEVFFVPFKSQYQLRIAPMPGATIDFNKFYQQFTFIICKNDK